VGESVLDYLRPRVFEPLGIDDPRWDRDPQGLPIGGYGLALRTEEIARFGQLYLQKGQWGGKQLVPASWVETATSRQVSNGSKPESDWEQGYGFQFWRCRHRAYRGDGAFGQFCVVLPEQDAVVAITSGVRSLQAVLDVVWNRLLPALHGERLADDAAARQELRAKLAGLTLASPLASAVPAVAPKATGRRYTFPANDQKVEAISLERRGDAVTLAGRWNGVEQRLALGRGEWRKGRLAYGAQPEQPVAASGAWTSSDTYTARIAFYETPFVLTLTLRFRGDEVSYDSEYNVAFAWSKKPNGLVGVASVGK
jgi:hypothetical protein